jgi:TolB protein
MIRWTHRGAASAPPRPAGRQEGRALPAARTSARRILAPLLFLPASLLPGLLLTPGGVTGQDVEERFPGVSLGITYEGRRASTLAIQPFVGRLGGEALAGRVEAIVARDLRYSNRFTVLDSLPSAFARDEVDYSLWDELGADFLVTGQVEGAGSGAVLMLELHDVVYREVRERGRFPMPNPDSPEFRMAAHVGSDALVYWATGEPGIAASRIAFSRRMEDGTQDLWVVDSDGENMRRMTNHRDLALSPAWAPDGRRVAYTSYRSGLPRVYELNLDTGQEKEVPAPRAGDYLTPAYAPDGQTLVFAVNGGGRSGLFSYNLARECCFTAVTEGRHEDISPSFSPDGRRLVFNSNRLGTGAPQIYVMAANGGRAEILSPYVYGRPGYYTSPEWSPVGDRVAYHGRIENRGRHQILISELGRSNRIVQLTFEGNNEDPSWAPDGRHLVYVGERSWGYGLFIVDAVTGNTRTLVSGIRPNLPAWSPSLAPSVAEQDR